MGVPSESASNALIYVTCGSNLLCPPQSRLSKHVADAAFLCIGIGVGIRHWRSKDDFLGSLRTQTGMKSFTKFDLRPLTPQSLQRSLSSSTLALRVSCHRQGLR